MRDPGVKQVEISSDGLYGRVVVDGQDVSTNLAGYEVAQFAGKVPQVVLHVAPASPVAFTGMARVAVAEPQDPGPAAAVFLRAIDPAELEKAALNRADLNPEQGGLTRAMLTQLVEWAEGR